MTKWISHNWPYNFDHKTGYKVPGESIRHYKCFKSGIPCGTRPIAHHPDLMGTNEEPWYSRGAIEFLALKMNNPSRVLEYGCGSSTIWFGVSQRVASITSIEHNEHWVNQVTQLIPENLKHKMNIVHVPSQEHGEHIGGDGQFYDNYVNHIYTLGGAFDLICVDGRSRSQCIINAIDRITDGGLLLIDNAEREQYHEAMSCVPSQWDRMDFSNDINTTVIFKVNR